MKKSSADNQHRKGNLEEVFRHGLGQGEVTPGADLWSRIDQQLDQQQQVGKYKRRAGYLALLSALLLLLAGSVALYTFWPGFKGAEVISDAGTGQPAAPGNAAVTNQKTAVTQHENTAHETGNLVLETAKTENAETENIADDNAIAASSSSSSKLNTLEAPLFTQQQQAASGNNAAASAQNNNQNNKKAAIAGVALTNQDQKKNKTKSTAEIDALSTKNNARTGNAATAKNNSAATENANAKQEDPVKKTTDNSAATPAILPPAASVNSPSGTSENQKQNLAAATPEQTILTEAEQQETNAAGANNAGVAADSLQQAKTNQITPDSTEQALVVSAPATDSARALPVPVVPAHVGRWTFSATYAGYQFEQGLVVSQTMPVTSLPVDNSDITRYQQAAQEFNEFTKPSSSYRVELRAGYWVHKLLRVEGGLSYARNKALTQNTYIIENYVLDAAGHMQMAGEVSIIEPLMNNMVRDSVAVRKSPGYETTYQYQYLALPVRLVYQSDMDGWHWFASGGASAGMLQKSNIESTRATGGNVNLGNTKGFRSWQFSGLFSFGLGYQIGERLSLQAGPDLSYSVNSLLGSRRVGVRQKNPYTVGLSGGVTFTFK